MKSDFRLKSVYLGHYVMRLTFYLDVLQLASWIGIWQGTGGTVASLPGGDGSPGSPLSLWSTDT